MPRIDKNEVRLRVHKRIRRRVRARPSVRA